MGLFDAKWKNEIIVEHKFSDIRIKDFISGSIVLKTKYSFLFLVVFQSIAVFIADIFIMGLAFAQLISAKAENKNEYKDMEWAKFIYLYRPYLYIFSVLGSSLLSMYEWRIAQKIIQSKDIASAFTSEMASTYYSIRSYAHFCFFQIVSNSTKLRDNLAFFVYFSFKNWKFTLAAAPRRILNILSIIILYKQNNNSVKQIFTSVTSNTAQSLKYETISTYASIFTVTIWILGIFRFLAAIIIYIPLVMTFIQGSVRAYATHKIDKRITQILNRKKKRKIVQDEKNRLMGKSKSKKEDGFNATLPDVGPVQEHIVGYDPQMTPHHSDRSFDFPTDNYYNNYPNMPDYGAYNTQTMVSSQVSGTMVSSNVSDMRYQNPSPQRQNRSKSPRKPRKKQSKESSSSATLNSDISPYRVRKH